LQQVPGILSQNLECHLQRSVSSRNVRDGISLEIAMAGYSRLENSLQGRRKEFAPDFVLPLIQLKEQHSCTENVRNFSNLERSFHFLTLWKQKCNA